MAGDVLLSVVDLETGYGNTRVLHRISLEVRQGEIVTLIGANGVGKTTTLSAISGLLPLGGGQVTFRNRRLNGLPPDVIVSLGIGHVPEGRHVLPLMTVRENLQLGAYLYKDKQRIEADMNAQFERFPILKERQAQLAGTLSGGEQQMLAIARGLMCRPKLLILDEPSLGLAPMLVAEIFRTIQAINREGVAVLLVEQNAYQALKIAHRGYVFETGKIALTDTGERLAANPKVKQAYLGG